MKKTEKGKRQSLQTQVFRILVILAGVSMLITAMVNYLFSSWIINSKEKAIYSSNVHALTKALDNIIENAEFIADAVTRNSVVQEVLKRNIYTSRDRYYASNNVAYSLAALSRYSDYIESVSVIGINGTLADSEFQVFSRQDYSEDPWFQAHLEDSGITWEYYAEEAPLIKKQEKGQVFCISPIHNNMNYKPLGIVVIRISSEVYSDIAAADEKGVQSFLYDSEGKMQFWLEKGDSVRIQKGVTVEDQLSNGWILVQQHDDSVFYSSARRLLLVTLLVGGITLFFASLYSKKESRRFTRRIEKMCEQMEHFGEGDFSVRLDCTGKDEITTLSVHFNQMAEHMIQLMDEIKKEEQKLHESEMRILQEQIKPHFLYNTLETVSWMIRFRQNEDAISMIDALSSYFRHSLNSGHEMISLKNEIEQVSSYMTIQEQRYRDKCSFSVVIDDEIKDKLDNYMVPKLILQPLAENALYHGIKEKDGGGDIELSVRQQGENISIQVRDNGVGMTPEMISVINGEEYGNGEAETAEGKQRGYGIGNVRQRIRMFYGEPYTLTYSSEENVGTVATIIIPADT